MDATSKAKTEYQLSEHYKKDFDAWNERKKELNKKTKTPFFAEREVWWVSIGANVGFEEDGKSAIFTRPVLIIKKFSKQLFLGIPMSTKTKKNKYYLIIKFQNNFSSILLSQIRILSAKRLKGKLGKIEPNEMEKIKKEFCDMILSSPRPS